MAFLTLPLLFPILPVKIIMAVDRISQCYTEIMEDKHMDREYHLMKHLCTVRIKIHKQDNFYISFYFIIIVPITDDMWQSIYSLLLLPQYLTAIWYLLFTLNRNCSLKKVTNMPNPSALSVFSFYNFSATFHRADHPLTFWFYLIL